MAIFNTWKKHYWYTIPVMRKRIEQIVEHVGTGKKVLEVGCNEGFVSKALLENGNEVVSSDFDQAVLDKANNVFEGLTTIKADANNLPFKDNEFEVVVAGELLEHLDNPFAGLNELFRVASEIVVVSLPIGEYWLGELTHYWELQGATIEHDDAEVRKMPKDILVLSWKRRRDVDLKDIPPFNTAEHKKKYNIR